MAASHGGHSERMTLVAVLFLSASVSAAEGDAALAEEHTAEAVALLDHLADEGHEAAAGELQRISDMLPSETMRLAAQYSVDATVKKKKGGE